MAPPSKWRRVDASTSSVVEADDEEQEAPATGSSESSWPQQEEDLVDLLARARTASNVSGHEQPALDPPGMPPGDSDSDSDDPKLSDVRDVPNASDESDESDRAIGAKGRRVGPDASDASDASDESGESDNSVSGNSDRSGASAAEEEDDSASGTGSTQKYNAISRAVAEISSHIKHTMSLCLPVARAHAGMCVSDLHSLIESYSTVYAELVDVDKKLSNLPQLEEVLGNKIEKARTSQKKQKSTHKKKVQQLLVSSRDACVTASGKELLDHFNACVGRQARLTDLRPSNLPALLQLEGLQPSKLIHEWITGLHQKTRSFARRASSSAEPSKRGALWACSTNLRLAVIEDAIAKCVRQHQCSPLQVAMSSFLVLCGCKDKALQVLNLLGLTVSQKVVQRALASSADAVEPLHCTETCAVCADNCGYFMPTRQLCAGKTTKYLNTCNLFEYTVHMPQHMPFVQFSTEHNNMLVWARRIAITYSQQNVESQKMWDIALHDATNDINISRGTGDINPCQATTFHVLPVVLPGSYPRRAGHPSQFRGNIGDTAWLGHKVISLMETLMVGDNQIPALLFAGDEQLFESLWKLKFQFPAMFSLVVPIPGLPFNNFFPL
jgi:hypothetical protein